MTGAFLQAAQTTLLVLATVAGVLAVLAPLSLAAFSAWRWWPRLTARLRIGPRLRHRRRVKRIRKQYEKSGRTL